MSAALVMEDTTVDRFEVAAASFTALVGRLKGDETAGMSLGDLETFLDKEGREVLRQLLQAHLARRAEAKATTPVVGADGVERTHHREGERELETLLGARLRVAASNQFRAHPRVFVWLPDHIRRPARWRCAPPGDPARRGSTSTAPFTTKPVGPPQPCNPAKRGS